MLKTHRVALIAEGLASNCPSIFLRSKPMFANLD